MRQCVCVWLPGSRWYDIGCCRPSVKAFIFIIWFIIASSRQYQRIGWWFGQYIADIGYPRMGNTCSHMMMNNTRRISAIHVGVECLTSLIFRSSNILHKCVVEHQSDAVQIWCVCVFVVYHMNVSNIVAKIIAIHRPVMNCWVMMRLLYNVQVDMIQL